MNGLRVVLGGLSGVRPPSGATARFEDDGSGGSRITVNRQDDVGTRGRFERRRRAASSAGV